MSPNCSRANPEGGNANLAFQGILSKAASICRELQMPELCSPKQSCVFTCVSADCANYFQMISKTRDRIYSTARLSAFWFFYEWACICTFMCVRVWVQVRVCVWCVCVHAHVHASKPEVDLGTFLGYYPHALRQGCAGEF